ncbi:4Fe-4S dicluster domain-containing protein [Emticicia sp. 21SJ11W-3]|uniref:4Fe-4S dicluster domain-containing protein n=1 Tax=Emticicia sp. 21SJ11W-3 TaxID=2916755 RepID=UPI00209EC7AA|nr:4Fe-4S dicluster domain-containing protein [Emticicia sp. 21SJ11W-3]UTA69612.1 4Fe-4S dicluster domain-containing protein [Emticicia sp. 21SJ11W-3]
MRKDLADRKDIEMGYFKDIKLGIQTTVKGMSLTLRHFLNARQSRKPISVQDPDYFKQDVGIATLQFPHETIAVPDNGRYQLDCEIDDCIVCDKCAKVCPIDCIDIEPIKSAGIIDYASDGSPIRLYAGRFDIDMAKCCFCGLCTTVCPTECLTMTNEYNFSVVDVADMNFAFSNLSPAQAEEKKKLYNDYVAAKEAFKAIPKESIPEVEMPEKKPKTTFKPAMRPVVKPAAEKEDTDKEPETKADDPKPAFKPAFKPVMKPKIADAENIIQEDGKQEETPKPKTSFKPVFKPAVKPETEAPQSIAPEEAAQEAAPKSKPAFTPKFKAVSKPETSEPESIASEEVTQEEAPKPKPAFVPKFKAVTKPAETSAEDKTGTAIPAAEIVPSIEAKAEDIELEMPVKAAVEEAAPKPKPAFLPKFRAVTKPAETSAEDKTETPIPAAELVPSVEAKAEDNELEIPVKAEVEEAAPKPKSAFVPKFRAVAKPAETSTEDKTETAIPAAEIVPTIEAKAEDNELEIPVKAEVEEAAPKPKPAFVPKFKAVAKPAETSAEDKTETALPAAELVPSVEAKAEDIELGLTAEVIYENVPEITSVLNESAEPAMVEADIKDVEETKEIESPGAVFMPSVEVEVQSEIVDTEKTAEAISTGPVEEAEKRETIEKPVTEETPEAALLPVDTVSVIESSTKTAEKEPPLAKEQVTEPAPLPEPVTDANKEAEPTISLFGDFAPKDTPKPKAKAAPKPAASQSLFDIDGPAGEKVPKETLKPKGRSAPKPPKQQSLFDFSSPEE